MEVQAFAAAVADLRGDISPRVWSLLVTVFGELARDGAAIPAAVLGEITTRIGIRPEAMRVALHRLRKDGWIDSTRQGRSSHYRLTAEGRAQTVAATPRIYAVDPPSESAFLVLTDPSSPLIWSDKDVWVTPHAVLTARPPQGAEIFATPLSAAQVLPRWMRAKTCDDATAALSADLAARLGRLEGALDRADLPDPLQTAALRVLVVHSWRRIVLKAPDLPDFVLPDTWAGPDCRARISRLLARLPRPTPETLAQAT
ncbi:PaaX family transcriptional regulator C-terminal domain-containing protein [Antarctobacter heliothermus]|uniref:Transcriptional regulator, PaaX family n=1 Tax=Antarctobacter heliothermus TaxID=74033 RepID=A0A239JK62_9RHOB|nr:PaaX family transcriptional regulator C-terminal domain-containing protein [Antarctobacter heliothermus]SNT05134.1 transcriptional regulator, PaaX family [Antarctobacter heliothermus]